jgi:hypothetical protein
VPPHRATREARHLKKTAPEGRFHTAKAKKGWPTSHPNQVDDFPTLRAIQHRPSADRADSLAPGILRQVRLSVQHSLCYTHPKCINQIVTKDFSAVSIHPLREVMSGFPPPEWEWTSDSCPDLEQRLHECRRAILWCSQGQRTPLLTRPSASSRPSAQTLPITAFGHIPRPCTGKRSHIYRPWRPSLWPPPPTLLIVQSFWAQNRLDQKKNFNKSGNFMDQSTHNGHLPYQISTP